MKNKIYIHIYYYVYCLKLHERCLFTLRQNELYSVIFLIATGSLLKVDAAEC